MKSWHLCERWHDKGLPCPFHVRLPEEEAHREIIDDEQEPAAVPGPELIGEGEEPVTADVPAKQDAAAEVLKSEIRAPVEILCSCIRSLDVVGLMEAAKITLANQSPLIRAMGQPPTVPSRTEPAPPVRPDKTISNTTAGIHSQPTNADDFLRGMVEEQVATAFATAAANNTVNAVAPNTVGSRAQNWDAIAWEETGMTGEQMVQTVAGAAIEGALPIIRNEVSSIQKAITKPPAGVVQNTATATPKTPAPKPPAPMKSITPRIVRTVIGGNTYLGGRGGYGGFITQAPTYRADLPVGPVGFNLAEDSKSIQFNQVFAWELAE